MNCCCFAPAHVFPLISSTVSFFPTGLLHGRGRKPHKLGLSITSQYIITSQTAEVQVGLLSGRTARCDPQPSRTVCELLEEAQSKLGIGIQQLVTSSGMTLNQDFTLEEAGIDYAGHVFALASVNEDEA
ncbi:unnamed protein product, partial [Durusdinium trenchii]